MSVYIKGMEIPTSCGECKAFVCYRQWAGDMGDCFCGITKNDAKAKEKNADCPLVPVPPHGRLIDADAVMNSVTDDKGVYVSQFAAVIGETVDDAPTIIPADPAEGGRVMDANLEAMLIRVIEQYRAAHPEEAAEADQMCKDYKPFSEIEPAIFSIEEGE